MRYIILCLFVAACTVNASPEIARYGSMSTVDLWVRHGHPLSPLELALVEAELGVRGEERFGRDYLGKRTASAFGRALYARTPAQTNSMNCSDFPNPAAAQRFFLKNGGPLSDPHDLDRDGDGLACEWGPHLTRLSQAHFEPLPVFSRSYAPVCHTGPRGGTYTITASGHKNYGGC